MTRRLRAVAETLAVVCAAAAAVVPWPPPGVERWFSDGAYPPIQRTLTSASNLVPVAWLDVLVLALAAALMRLWWHAARGADAPGAVRLGRALRTTAAGTACVYLTFLAAWGLNYRRVPLTQRLVAGSTVVTTEAVTALGREAVRRLNALDAAAHAAGWPASVWHDEPLRRAATAVQQQLGRATPAVPARLKRSLLGVVFRWEGVDAMTSPWGLEVLVNPDLLPFERPFVAAHEWGHLAGYADEAEANFVGWLTCLRADASSQYSGWLYLYWQVAAELPASSRADVAGALADGPRRDLDRIAERLRRGEVRWVRDAGWAAYDQYLKANRVEAGVRSYGEVVSLIVRSRFDEGWRPVLRP